RGAGGGRGGGRGGAGGGAGGSPLAGRRTRIAIRTPGGTAGIADTFPAAPTSPFRLERTRATASPVPAMSSAIRSRDRSRTNPDVQTAAASDRHWSKSRTLVVPVASLASDAKTNGARISPRTSR